MPQAGRHTGPERSYRTAPVPPLSVSFSSWTHDWLFLSTLVRPQKVPLKRFVRVFGGNTNWDLLPPVPVTTRWILDPHIGHTAQTSCRYVPIQWVCERWVSHPWTVVWGCCLPLFDWERRLWNNSRYPFCIHSLRRKNVVLCVSLCSKTDVSSVIQTTMMNHIFVHPRWICSVKNLHLYQLWSHLDSLVLSSNYDS